MRKILSILSHNIVAKVFFDHNIIHRLYFVEKSSEKTQWKVALTHQHHRQDAGPLATTEFPDSI